MRRDIMKWLEAPAIAPELLELDPVPLLPGCVALGEFLNLSEPHASDLQVG